MLAQQSLRRPVNGQEFENLCLKLWGEIWNYPEIQKVGRSGQSQHGVDIVGRPAGEQGWWGIQCKGKSEYNDEQYQHPQFSEAEIDRQIEEAKSFEPALRKLYFATTALRDSKIQAYIRKKNDALQSDKLFEVHLFSWEDIVERIDENKVTHDWYINNKKYRQDRQADVFFSDGSTKLEASAKFRQINKRYCQKILPRSGNTYEATMADIYHPAMARALRGPSALQMEVMTGENQSYFPVTLQIKNTGHTTIDDWKLVFELAGEWQDIRLSNLKYPVISPKAYQKRVFSVRLSSSKKAGEVVPADKNLVGDDIFTADPFFIKPLLTPTTIMIGWKVLGNEYKKEGQLLVNITPKVIVETDEELTEDFSLVAKGLVRGPIEDYIEYIKS